MTPKDFTDLFVYNYERAYPHDLDVRPVVVGLSRRPLMSGDLVAAVLLAIGAWMTLGTTGDGPRRPAQGPDARLPGPRRGPDLARHHQLPGAEEPADPPRVPRGRGRRTRALGCAERSEPAPALRPSRSWRWERRSLPSCSRSASSSPRFDTLATNLRAPVNVKTGMVWAFTLGGVAAALGALRGSRVGVVGSLGALALVFALWFSWSHWVDLSHHWTQRDLFWRYYDRRSPGEPIVAYMMDWKGETFYSRNTVKQIKDSPTRMAAFANLPGRKWALVEHPRLGLLRQAIGAEHRIEQVDRDLNVKFVLVTID